LVFENKGETIGVVHAIVGAEAQAVPRASGDETMTTLRDETVTVWSRFTTGKAWLVERSYPKHYVQDGLGMGEEGVYTEKEGRTYAWYHKGVNPNGSCHHWIPGP
jgi:hypothetical protein